MARKPLNKTVYCIIDQTDGRFAEPPYMDRRASERTVEDLNQRTSAILLEKKYVQRYRLERFCWVPRKTKA